jgi:hypothetical protein
MNFNNQLQLVLRNDLSIEFLIDNLPNHSASRTALVTQLRTWKKQMEFDKGQCHDQRILYNRTVQEEDRAPIETSEEDHKFGARLARLLRLAADQAADAHILVTQVALELIRLGWCWDL